jgi:hypothetical protein
MNTSTIPLDKIGQSIVAGKKPYYTTDVYKKSLNKRIA